MSDDFDFDKAASAFPDLDADDGAFLDAHDSFATAPTSAITAPTKSFSFDDFGSPPPPEVKVTGDSEIEKFEDQFPDIDVGPQSTFQQPTQSQPTFGAAPPFAPRPQPSVFSSTPILNQPIEEEEPQVIKDWRATQAEEIAARDAASAKRKAETVAAAERAIDNFYEEYSTKKERTIRENKEHETAYLAELSSSLSHGTTWERISEIIELQNSQSKTIARAGPGTTDLVRFREVLLRLKREGQSAPGAAGY